MNVSRQMIDSLPDALRANLHEASLYSSPTFASIWKAKSGRPVCWTVEKDTRVIAALTGVEFGRGPLTRFQAMPDGLPSSLCFIEKGTNPELAGQALLKGIFSHGYAKAFVTDYLNALSPGSEPESASCETALVELTPDWEPPDKTLRSEIRKAEREGATILPFSKDDHLDDFLRLLRATEKRLDIPSRYPDEFYESLSEVAAKDSRIVWAMAVTDGTAVASHVYLLDGTTALYWVSCFDKEFSYLKATQLLLQTQGRAFAIMGKTNLNLGQSPPEADSLETFKMKWGAARYHYRRYQSKSLIGRLR